MRTHSVLRRIFSISALHRKKSPSLVQMHSSPVWPGASALDPQTARNMHFWQFFYFWRTKNAFLQPNLDMAAWKTIQNSTTNPTHPTIMPLNWAWTFAIKEGVNSHSRQHTLSVKILQPRKTFQGRRRRRFEQEAGKIDDFDLRKGVIISLFYFFLFLSNFISFYAINF